MTESSAEQGYEDNICIPFVGAFQKLLNDMELDDVVFIFIGKSTRIVPCKDHVLVIGDSLQDLEFAKNNHFYFFQLF